MKVHWHDLTDYFYWSITLKSVKLKDANGNTFDLVTKQYFAILDSGTSFLLMPQKEFTLLLEIIQTKYMVSIDQQAPNGMRYGRCAYSDYINLPDMKIQIDQSIYTIPKESYILFQNNNCIMLIIAKDLNMWILGNNFLHNYYSIHDVANKRAGLVPSNLSKVGPIETAPAQFDFGSFGKNTMIGVVWILVIYFMWQLWKEYK